MNDSKKPSRPKLTLKDKGGGKPQEKPQQPQGSQPPTKPKGSAYTPPRLPAQPMDHFWMVMRDSGSRPKVRHATLQDAQQEASRIAAAYPGSQVWVIECRRVQTIISPSTTKV
jgi:hypothetical protein